SSPLMSLSHAPRQRDANVHGSAGLGDLVARRRALLSPVLTACSTRSDRPTTARRCRSSLHSGTSTRRPRPWGPDMTATTSRLDTRTADVPLAELRQTARSYALNPNLAA